MKYAVIKTGGKQYKIAEGDVIEVERLPLEKDKEVSFGEVLLFAGDGDPRIGSPFVPNALVTARVIDNVKGDKLRISKFKAKARYRRVTGHRQALTQIKIEKIALQEKSTRKSTVEAKEEAAVK